MVSRRSGGKGKKPARPAKRKAKKRPATRVARRTRAADRPMPPEVKSATLATPTEPARAEPGARVRKAVSVTKSRKPTIGPSVTAAAEPHRGPREAAGVPTIGVTVERLPPGRVVFADPGPLVLLPLRLEYRLVTRERRPTVVDFAEELRALAAIDSRRSGRTRAAEMARLRERRGAVSDLLKTAPRTRRIVLTGTRELWFRWYPDESFTTKGVAPPSTEETAAVEAFLNVLGGRPWFAPVDADAIAAWQTFATAVGPYRAVHLMRSRTAAPSGRYEEDIGRISALPDKVTLFAVTSSALSPLGSGVAIPANAAEARSQVSYTPEAIQPGGWLRDFALAEQLGMGLRLTDAATINTALGADHIIAVGRFGGDAKTELSDLLKDTIANGAFSFLRQDTPTNNAPGTKSGLVDPLKDLAGFLSIATQNESAQFAPVAETAAQLFAEALAIDPAIPRTAVHAADTPFVDAKAMLRVIGPAILDGALDGTTVVEGVDENTFIDVLARACCARGALSAVRFGNNPFGVLPMSTISQLAIDDPDTRVTSVQNFLKAYATFARDGLPQYAERVVPVLQPQDPQAAAKIETLLKTNRLSRRIDVADVGASTTAAIGCPYVSGSRPQDAPAVYLAGLRTSRFRDLPDPTDDDTGTPLLYRLARLTLTRNIVEPVIVNVRPVATRRSLRIFDAMEEDPTILRRIEATGAMNRSATELATGTGVTGMERSVLDLLGRLNTNFVAALRQLETIAARPNGIAELETLLIEVIDLLQHRVDAFATGLAYARLVRQRRNRNTGLGAGYYGFLGKLRPTSTTGTSDGFIQAPSMAQATTAALLRSAYLRHKADGAFEIDLSSRRVRRALTLLDVLKKGLALEEALGLRGERWLHDNKLSRLTFDLRATFPFVNPTPPESATTPGDTQPQTAGVRVFDGLKFIDGSLSAFTPTDRPSLQTLKSVMADDLDALSDVVLAEAVHRRALGHAEAAKAWLNVLSGSSVPGDPIFLRTQRHGQGSTHRVSILLKPAASPSTASPRGIAEPTLAALATTLLPDFASLSVVVTVARIDDPARRHELHVNLEADLDQRPIDLLIGGMSELQVRVRYHVISNWLVDPAFSAAVGVPVAEGLLAFVNGTVTITVAEPASGPSLATALAKAEKLRSLVQSGRMLEPSDLGAAATPAAPLSEAREIALIGEAVDILRSRVLALNTRLLADLDVLTTTQSRLMLDVRDARRRLDVDPGDPAVPALLAAAELKRRTLHDALARVSAYAEPTALRPFTIEEAVATPDALDDTLTTLIGRLEGKSRGLMEAHAGTTPASVLRLEEARGRRRRLIEALQAALDGTALPILPPVSRVDETTPLFGQPGTPAAVIGVWAGARPRVAQTVDVTAGLSGYRAHPVTAAATEDDPDPDDKDPRAEPDAPRAQHFGIFVATDAAIAATAYAGFVCDEWAEQRPSRTQLAAMAVNYDSPQSEPPQCVLLCVPPSSTFQSWSDDSAAAMVFETIQWMKVRALSTDDKPWPASLLPRANQVAFKGGSRRIPQRRFRFVDLGFTGFDGEFVIANTFPPGESLGSSKSDLNEIPGFHRVKE